MNKKRLYDMFMSIIYAYKIVGNLKSSTRIVYKKAEKSSLYVLGAGPSLNNFLNTISKTPLENTVYFALNDFSVSSYYSICKPKYYIMLDPGYWTPKDETNEDDYFLRIKTFDRLNLETTWQMTLFVPSEVYMSGVIHKAISNNNIKLKPFNYTNYYPTESSFYFWVLKHNFGVVPVGNVLGGAIYLAINMGYKDIRLIGAEHSWTEDIRVNDKNQVCTIKKHFYGEGSLEPWLKSNKEPFRMCEILSSLMNHFRGYIYLNWYAKKLDATIYNCTKGSFIDAFERA